LGNSTESKKPADFAAFPHIHRHDIGMETAKVMDKGYEAFCLADPQFYDNAGAGDADEAFRLTSREAPHLWQRAEQGNWVIVTPDDHQLPTQGWKVHVSGRLDNAERIIEIVWGYCVSRDVAFKFLRSRRVVLARNAKYAARGGSGKLVTVYPRDDAELRHVCRDLDARLAGELGPYILSDLRWGDGPVHVRYGGFSPRWCTDKDGRQVLAIEDANGRLVPDERGPVFAVPAWVTPPECLAPHLAARAATTLGDLPYRIDRALHFSNGGGVYGGVDLRPDRNHARVVLKEARPHAGLSGDGTDAVTRLRRERQALERLAGLDAVPQMVDYRTVGEHEFLVMEHIEGEALNTALARRCPLLTSTLDPTAAAEYAEWAMGVHAQVEAALLRIHERGIVYGDLHMFNVLVRPDGDICLIDFEVAADADAPQRPGLGAVGYVAPADRTGKAIDLYALACLRLALFLPLERLMNLDRRKARHLAVLIAEHFPVPADWLDEAVEVIAPGTAGSTPPAAWRVEPDPAGWEDLRATIAGGILASATLGRDDRLFPGDVAGFEGRGIGVAFGAAGVLHALDLTGAGRFPDHEDWLVRHALEPDPQPRLGFYDGLHGVAHVLAGLGHAEAAAKLMDRCLEADWSRAPLDLHAGLAGMGLNFAHMADATGDPALHEAAQRATQLVVDRLDDMMDLPYAGLMRGTSGPALLLIRMFERTGDPELLDHALTALYMDLWRCVEVAGGTQLHVEDGSRTLPYLAIGSAGIGLVLRRYLAHRSDDGLAQRMEAIEAAARALFYVQPGLFNGRAGLVLLLADRQQQHQGDLPDDLAAQVRRLSWHALSYRDQLAFPGDQLLRLSMDLATGSAGVLLALGAVLHPTPVHLPFLDVGLSPIRPDPERR
jgi:serine/threonine protein kinase